MFLLHYVMFGCIFDRFVATLNSVQMDQSGAINAKVRATKSHLNLSLQMRTWDHFATALNSVQNGPTGAINAEVHATKSRRNFLLRTQEKHTMGP